MPCIEAATGTFVLFAQKCPDVMLVAVLNKINFTEDSKMKIQETVNEQDILSAKTAHDPRSRSAEGALSSVAV